MPITKRRLFLGKKTEEGAESRDVFLDVYDKDDNYFAAGLDSFLSKPKLEGRGVSGQETDALLHMNFPQNWVDPTDIKVGSPNPIVEKSFVIFPTVVMQDDAGTAGDMLFYQNLYQFLRERSSNPPVTIQMPFSYRGGRAPHGMLLNITIDAAGQATVKLINPFGETSGYNDCLERILPFIGRAFDDYERYRKDSKADRTALSPQLVDIATEVTQFDGKCCGLQLINNVTKAARAHGDVDMSIADKVLPQTAFSAATTSGMNSNDSLHQLQANTRAELSIRPAVTPVADLASYIVPEDKIAEDADTLKDSLKLTSSKYVNGTYKAVGAGEKFKTLSEEEFTALLSKVSGKLADKMGPPADPTPKPKTPDIPAAAVTALKITEFVSHAATEVAFTDIKIEKAANDDKWELKNSKDEPQGNMAFNERTQTLRMDLTQNADPSDPAKLIAHTLYKSYASLIKKEPIYLTFDAGRDDDKTRELAEKIIAELKAKNVPESDIILECTDTDLKKELIDIKNLAFGKTTPPAPGEDDELEIHASQAKL